ncbi:MAG: sulfotransferase family protein, partial [Waterburya sp.]
MNVPNFIVIGAAKSGTTSLYRYLNQHPSIYLSPIKETNFFATKFVDTIPLFQDLDLTLEQAKKNTFPVKNFTDYQRLFEEATSNQTAIGEVSPLYLNSFVAAQKIKSHIPDVKLIAILRNPIDRAYSGYQMQLRQAKETRGFASNLGVEEIYIRGGFYYEQLKRYFETFNSCQIKVLLYEDFRKNPLKVMQEIFKFIEVDDTFAPDTSTKFNQGGIPKNVNAYNLVLNNKISTIVQKSLKAMMPPKIRQKLISEVQSRLLSKPQPLTPEIRRQLKEIYQNDVYKLEQLINRNLQQ